MLNPQRINTASTKAMVRRVSVVNNAFNVFSVAVYSRASSIQGLMLSNSTALWYEVKSISWGEKITTTSSSCSVYCYRKASEVKSEQFSYGCPLATTDHVNS